MSNLPSDKVEIDEKGHKRHNGMTIITKYE